jgi:AcrR family transcriptional regulator
MPKVTEAYLAERRQQIIDAAFACFARSGFHQTTMEDIGREANLSPGLPYRYFSSKEEIIRVVFTESLSRLGAIEQAGDQADFPTYIKNALRYVLAGLESPGSHTRWNVRLQAFALAARRPEDAATLRRVRGEVFDLIQENVQTGQEQGDVDPSLDARAVARVLIATIDGLALQWTADPEMDIWQAVEVVNALFNGTFRPTE